MMSVDLFAFVVVLTLLLPSLQEGGAPTSNCGAGGQITCSDCECNDHVYKYECVRESKRDCNLEESREMNVGSKSHSKITNRTVENRTEKRESGIIRGQGAGRPIGRDDDKRPEKEEDQRLLSNPGDVGGENGRRRGVEAESITMRRGGDEYDHDGVSLGNSVGKPDNKEGRRAPDGNEDRRPCKPRDDGVGETTGITRDGVEEEESRRVGGTRAIPQGKVSCSPVEQMTGDQYKTRQDQDKRLPGMARCKPEGSGVGHRGRRRRGDDTKGRGVWGMSGANNEYDHYGVSLGGKPDGRERRGPTTGNEDRRPENEVGTKQCKPRAERDDDRRGGAGSGSITMRIGGNGGVNFGRKPDDRAGQRHRPNKNGRSDTMRGRDSEYDHDGVSLGNSEGRRPKTEEATRQSKPEDCRDYRDCRDCRVEAGSRTITNGRNEYVFDEVSFEKLADGRERSGNEESRHGGGQEDDAGGRQHLTAVEGGSNTMRVRTNDCNHNGVSLGNLECEGCEVGDGSENSGSNVVIDKKQFRKESCCCWSKFEDYYQQNADGTKKCTGEPVNGKGNRGDDCGRRCKGRHKGGFDGLNNDGIHLTKPVRVNRNEREGRKGKSLDVVWDGGFVGQHDDHGVSLGYRKIFIA